jgi:hypothetical protein
MSDSELAAVARASFPVPALIAGTGPSLPLLRAYQKQQLKLRSGQQQSLSATLSDQTAHTVDPGNANSTAQAELLRAEQLSFEHNTQLASYAQAKAQQVDSLQASLQSAIHSQAAKLAAIEQ